MLVVNLADHVLHWSSLILGPGGAVALLVVARARGLSWQELGLARHSHARGLRWAAGVIGVIAAGYLVGVLLPVTRTAFLDLRYHLPPAQVLFTAFVMIPVGTVLFEELAFRSVLWGLLHRLTHVRWVLLGSSALFGLWHVLPAVAGAANLAVGAALAGLGGAAQLVAVAGTVSFTAVGGVVAGELRRRSGSLLASVGMHWATNALGVLFGMLAWQLS
jgi:membrane protease YdiL (CAAX protease family)